MCPIGETMFSKCRNCFVLLDIFLSKKFDIKLNSVNKWYVVQLFVVHGHSDDNNNKICTETMRELNK